MPNCSRSSFHSLKTKRRLIKDLAGSEQKSTIGNRQSQIVNRIAPRGFEPLERNSQALETVALTENPSGVLASCLALLSPKHPDLALLIEAWPSLPPDVKKQITRLVKNQQTQIEF